MPSRPEQGAALEVPQLDRFIPAPADQRASIRAKSEGIRRVGMRLPVPYQGLAFLLPDAHLPTLTGGRPVLPVAADIHRPDGIVGLGKDGVMDQRSGERCILHLDALQIHSAKREIRQIETTQCPRCKRSSTSKLAGP